MKRLFACFIFTLILSLTVSASDDAVKQEPAIVTINDQQILLSDFMRSLQEGVRQTFYHGKIPDAEFVKFRHKTLSTLIESYLLHLHGVNEGVEPDHELVNKRLEKIKERYKNHPQWSKNKDSILATIRLDTERASIVNKIEKKIKGEVKPTELQVVKYYKEHPEKFTTPRQNDIAVIMLRIDPSSGVEGWEAGRKEASSLYGDIVKDLTKFGELAKIHSSHSTAERNGEMGLVHTGTMAEEIEKKLSTMKAGDVSEPIKILEGYAIVKLNRMVEAKLNSFDVVKKRAERLCQRNLQDLVWEQLKQKLKDESKIYINMEELNNISLAK